MLIESVLDRLLAESVAVDHWFVGFSGGIDSTVLLHSLALWRAEKTAAPPLSAIHVNHHLSAHSEFWQQHCQQVCDELGVPLHCSSVDVSAHGDGESAARAARYEVFEALVGKHQALFLAHHLDDQVETFFLRLMRGAGIDGLAAMPVSRPIGRGLLLRPLLECTRDDIESFAKHHALAVIEDPSNLNTDIDRNLIRHEVLPLLAGRWPAYRRTVSRAANHMAEAARSRDEALNLPVLRTVTDDPGIELAALTHCELPQAAVRLRFWLRQQGLQVPDQASLDEFLRQLRNSEESAAPQLNTADYGLERFGQGVFLRPQFEHPPPTAVPVSLEHPLTLPGVGRITFVAARNSGFALTASARLELRWRKGGETCRPRGRGGSAALKKVLQECAVPRWWRARVPLLYSGEALLCIADLVQCEPTIAKPADLGGEPLWRMVWEPSAV